MASKKNRGPSILDEAADMVTKNIVEPVKKAFARVTKTTKKQTPRGRRRRPQRR